MAAQLEWTEVELLSFDTGDLPRVQACLVDGVSNGAAVLSAVRQGTFERVLFLRSSRIGSVFVLVVAILRALFSHREGKTLGLEIMQALCASRNIGAALREFGIKSDDHCMLLVAFDATDDDRQAVAELLAGCRTLPVDQLPDMYDLEQAKKFYKLSESERATRSSAMQAIVNRIALGGALQ